MDDTPEQEHGPAGESMHEGQDGLDDGGDEERHDHTGGDSGLGDRDDRDRDDDHFRWHVHGTVSDGTGAFVAEAGVTLYWQQIRARAELARGRTDEAGIYHLLYEVPEDAPQPVLVVVEVLAADAAPVDSALTTAAPELLVNVVLQPADTSEWGELTAKAARFLGALTLAEVVQDGEHSDISFLAAELSVSTESVMRLAVSARLEASFQLPAALFYAFLRQQVPAALPRPLLDASDGFQLIDALVARVASMVFGLDATTQRRTILAAVAAGYVPASLTGEVDTLVGELQTHQQSDLLSHPYLVGSATLGQLLDVVAIPVAQQQAFAAALVANTQTMRTFWRTLGDGSHGLTAEQASAIERSLTIGSFVKNYVPLVQELVGQFDAGTYTQLHDLARISLQDWESSVARTGAPPGVQPAGSATPEQVFAAVVYTRITRVYPTAALSSRVAAGGVVPAAEVQPVQQFFTNNPDLELVKQNLPSYLEQKGDAAFAGIAEDARTAVVASVRRMQRVLKVAPEVDVAEVLLRSGISSATDIATLGEAQFFTTAKAAGLTTYEATVVFGNAVQRYATVIALYSQLNVDAVGLWPQDVGDLAEYNGLTQQAIQRDDSLATLFGSQSYCATDDCTSILSPAAYLCDLLLWLRGHRTGKKTALDILDGRRPDIRHLLLDCPNTDTELPYIDLVVELLADAVSPPSDTISTTYLQRGLTDGTTYYWIVTAVNSLGEGPSSAQVSATPAAPIAVPPSPAGLALAIGDSQLTVTFDPVAGATSYNLYYGDAPGVTTSNGTQILDVTSPYSLGGLTDGTTYGVIVTAVNAQGEGTASAEVDAAPAAPVAVPIAPTGLAVTVGDGELTITWDPVAGATSYNLYYATSPGVTPATGTELPGVGSPYVQSGLVDVTTYYYVVTAENGLGEGAPSVEVSATPEAPTLVPPAPTGLTVLAGDGEATLSWDPVSGATSYNLYFSTSPGVTTATGTEIPGSWNPRWKQTSASATPAQLAAAPAYFNQGAFVVLAGAAYPSGLPYSAGLDELRTVLAQWTLPLWQLRQSLLPLSGATLAQYVAVAAERFAMSPLAAALATTSGLVPLTVAWNDHHPGIDLAPVEAFLPASGLTYEQLIELLEVQFVQDGLGIAIEGADDLCDTGEQQLAPAPLDGGFLDRADRFLRVWVATGWKMWELDLLLASPAVGAGALDQNALVALFAFRSLQDASGLAVDQLLAWYGDMDTESHRDPDGSPTTPLYARTFLDPSVSVLAPDRDLAVLPTGGTVADPLLADHLPAVQAGLGVSAADAATLAGLTDGNLTLDNLSLMYRVASLATTAKLAISDLLTVAGLLQPGAVSATAALAPLLASPAASLAFVQQASAIKQCGLSLDALTYLLTPPSPAVPGGWTTTTQMSAGDLTSALDAVRAAVSLAPAGTTLAAPINALQTTVTVLADSGFPPAPFAIAIGSEVMSVTAVGGTGNTTWTVLRAQQSTVAAAAAAGAAVSLAGGPLAGNIVAAVAANAHPAGLLGIADDVTSLVLSTLLLPGTASTLIEVLADPAFTSSATPVSQAGFPNQWLALQLFDKVAVLVRSLRLVEPEVAFLLDNSTHFGGLDLTALPVLPAQPALPLGALLTTTLLVTLARTWTAPSTSSPVQTLYDVIGGVIAGTIPDAPSAQAAFAAVTGWSATDLAAFATSLQLAYPAGYEQPASYDALRRLQAMAAKAGVRGATLVGWATVPADEVTAQGLGGSALSALKAQQPSNDAWLALAPSLTDPMRERRAAALVAYLSAQRDLTGAYVYGDADGLFDHFLIDVEMSSCQLTSRVVQAYLAVQIFVERCLMGEEAPAVVADPQTDSTWSYWSFMDRYRVWEANREVFCYPENWLIESQRANRTEDYVTFEQEVRQGPLTADYLETVVLNYIDRLDQVAHLRVTGTCEDPSTGDLYVVARTLADPPTYYTRTLSGGEWSGWSKVPLDIKANEVVPAVFRGRLCLFWADVTLANEPQQNMPLAQASEAQAPQYTDRYVSLGLWFSIYRNSSWQPAQASKGKLFDKPLFDPTRANDKRAVEELYSIRVVSAPSNQGYGAALWVDVFRYGSYNVESASIVVTTINLLEYDPTTATQIGRAVFDGKFSDLELADFDIIIDAPLVEYASNIWVALGGGGTIVDLLTHAQASYGPDALPLLPLSAADPPLTGEPGGVVPEAGALVTGPADIGGGSSQTLPLVFTNVSALDQTTGPLLQTAPVPFRLVGPDNNLNLDPATYFFFSDSHRAWYVESDVFYWTGSFWSPTTPSDPSSASYQVRYVFHPFYHPFTGLFWHQLSGGGFETLYDANLQENPDQIDPTGADVFGFQAAYAPVLAYVSWDHDDITGADRQFLDFRRSATFSVYNWELFYHVPLYVAQLLSQNQQFEDAQTWLRYIFNPARQSSDPVPQRYWIPKPFHNLSVSAILGQQINSLLQAVNQGDPSAVAEVAAWKADPFDPFLLADLRPVAYMKSAVMSYLDNLIAWGDNLFATESREALNEATLLYVTASEILGPTPSAVTPPAHADQCFDQLEPLLDAFANALVEVENVIGGAGGGGGGGGGGLPMPQTFYFKIPSNPQLLGYWSTVADRLYKLRHCQSVTGEPLSLSLFDAPIDPGLLIAAQAAGVDLSSVLSDVAATLPSYRFTALYTIASDFVNAVRAYGTSLQAALEKVDAGSLALLQQTTQQQLLIDGDQVLDWQVQQAQSNLEATQASLLLAQHRQQFNSSQEVNAGEITAAALTTTAQVMKTIAAATHVTAAVAHIAPDATVGAAGFGGSPYAVATDGGTHAGHAASSAGFGITGISDLTALAGSLTATIAGWGRRADNWSEAAKEAGDQIDQANAQIAAGQFALQVAELNQTLHQEQIDNLQKQIDLLNDKFTDDALYDWMVSSLAATYFQSYQLAVQICKQLERCYRFELGVADSSFIQFGYWDSLHKGLLAGETLNHDLRRMESSYLQQNARRYELSRFVSLSQLDPLAFRLLLVSGACDFDLPESLFDHDYPGHYNRRLVRVSLTVVYPNPGKFDNVKTTLTLVANKVRTSPDATPGYAEAPIGSDPRFVYDYAAVPQKIATGNAQDDPGLFVQAIASNITDQRYLPFENAGAVSSWHLELPEQYNEVDLSTVGDVVLHLHYTALEGGADLQQAVEQNNAATAPTSGIKVFSALNDFPAPTATVANPYPLTPWQTFLSTVTAPANQVLTLAISPSKFPPFVRGRTITVTAVDVLTVSWPPGNFVVQVNPPLETTPTTLTMTPLPGVSEPNICAATVNPPAGAGLGTWSFEIQKQGAADFRSLGHNDLGDVILLVHYDVS